MGCLSPAAIAGIASLFLRFHVAPEIQQAFWHGTASGGGGGIISENLSDTIVTSETLTPSINGGNFVTELLSDNIVTSETLSFNIPGVTIAHVTDQNNGETWCASGLGCTHSTGSPISAVMALAASNCAYQGHVFLIPAGTYHEAFPEVSNTAGTCSPPSPWVYWLKAVNGGYVTAANTGGVTNGKGVLTINSCPAIIDGFELANGGSPGGEEDGIMMDEFCLQLIVVNSWMHDGNNGILTADSVNTPGEQNIPGLLVVLNSILNYNGDKSGFFGHIHNLYMGQMGNGDTGSAVVFVNNLSSCVYQGHLFKSRADFNYLIGNRILACDRQTSNITSGTYDPSTGNVSLTVSPSMHLSRYDQISVAPTGTGSVSVLSSSSSAEAGTNGTTINYTALDGGCIGYAVSGTFFSLSACNANRPGLRAGDPILADIGNSDNLPAGLAITDPGTCGAGGSCPMNQNVSFNSAAAYAPFNFGAANLTLTITGGTVHDRWGETGHLIDIPNGTMADIENNTIYMGLDNATAIHINHGGEVPNPLQNHDMLITNNTVISNYNPGAQFVWEEATNGTRHLRPAIAGNTFYHIDPGGVFFTGAVPEVSNVPYDINNSFAPLASAPALDYSTPATCH